MLKEIYFILTRVGMTLHEPIKLYPFNLRNTIMVLIFSMGLISNVMFLIYGATNLSEYTDSIYLLITGQSSSLNFAFVTWKMVEIFRFLEDLEDTIRSSKGYIIIIIFV